MHEATLVGYMTGIFDGAGLAADLIGVQIRPNLPGTRSSDNYSVVALEQDFQLEPPHLARLIDATLSGAITPDQLSMVAFLLHAADRFVWDTETAAGERVANAIFWLSTPELNYPLSADTLTRMR